MPIVSGLIYGIPAEFTTVMSSDAALAKLNDLIRWEKGKLDLVGVVNSELVRLRLNYTFGRTNGTRFEGALVKSECGSVLAGHFVASAGTRLTSTLFLAIAALFFLSSMISGVDELAIHAFTMLEAFWHLGLLMLWLAGLGLLAFVSIWNASPTRRDVDAISTAIRTALILDQR